MGGEDTLLARRIEESDLSTRVEWLNDPKTRNGIAIEGPISVAQTKQWLNRTLADPSRLDVVFSRSENGPLLAMGGLTGISHRDSHAELYVFVKPGEFGRGIG